MTTPLRLAAAIVLPLVAISTGAAQPALAADSEVIVLDPFDVTATREKARVVDIAAATAALDRPAIQATGAANPFDALRFGEGVLTNSMGPGGQAWGGMTSKAIMRGSARGTLVLLDGVPMNVNGYYNLEDVPLDIVSRIETVRGASSVLYGSEAVGGVINIITDDSTRNGVSVRAGSDDYQSYSVSAHVDWTLEGTPGSLGVIGSYQNQGETTGLSSTGNGFGGGIKRSVRWALNQGGWRLWHQHVENDYAYWKYTDLVDWARTSVTQKSDYEDVKDHVRLSGSGEHWRANAYVNLQQRDYLRTSKANTKPTLDRDEDYLASTYGADAQYHFDLDWFELLAGGTYEHERYDNENKMNGGHDVADRDSASVFVRAQRTFADTWILSAGARESYVSSGDLNAFTPQVQLVKKLTGRFSAYANVGRSFNMPSLKQLYDESGIFTGGNANLQPEHGWNYETGLKWEGETSLARLSVFHMDFESISYVYVAAEDRNYPQNLPFQNTGVELSWRQKFGSDWAVDTGLSYGNPEEQKTAGVWSQKYGRWQANTMLRWQHKIWSASFGLSYLGDRPYWRDQYLSTFRAAVDLGRFGKVSVSVDNVFNRRDVTTHTASAYYATPRAVRVGFEKYF